MEMRKCQLRSVVTAIAVFLALLGCQARAPTDSDRQAITLVDSKDEVVTVNAPVERIISVNSGLTALVYALGGGERLIGRDRYSTFPLAAQQVQVVAQSSAAPDMESMIGLAPDLVVADTQLKPEHREKLDAAGIPALVYRTSDPDQLLNLVESLGLALGEEARADKLVAFIEEHTDLVDERLVDLQDQRPKVYFEWQAPFKSASSALSYHKPIVRAGGINIAADQPTSAPALSAEWIINQNPDVIVKRISGDATLQDMQEIHQEVVSRPGWENIAAVQNGQVYIVKADVFLTFRYPVGLLYYAKWFHPDRFADVDPQAVHQELIERFLGDQEWQTLQEQETFVYPE
jgi:iron complex transport system substrate-binding protein